MSTVCSDYNAVFNTETELCECAVGFYDTTFGCQPFEDAECHPRFRIGIENFSIIQIF